MTTILGMKTSGDEEAVVLAADTQLSFGQLKTESSKIWTDNKNYAIGYAGNVDKYLDSYFSYLSGNRDFQSFLAFASGEKKEDRLKELLYSFGQPPRKVKKRIQELNGDSKSISKIEEVIKQHLKNIESSRSAVDEFIGAMLGKITEYSHPVEKAIRLRYFLELNILNGYYTKRCESEGVESEQTTELLIASNKGLLGLYRVNSFGIVEAAPESDEFEYLCLGSGSDIAIKYISEGEYEEDNYVKSKIEGKNEERIKLDNVTTRTACALAIGALKKAKTKDKNSGGIIEVVTVRKNRIVSYREVLQNNLQKTEYDTYDYILDQETPKIERSDGE
ncbi:MAG: hypothetical protein ABH824_01470 [Nanoarchaeota archaeon]|nr:hypothetical protein [Nanoarchaeota archaeon]MBU1631778.1 hypothetical protein [Nanoarchaeota archaeon]MBU1876287.1 hypothetical protein [Nanoarchaeota archaeon]